jgi:two-component system, NarL family, response regulator LiaR
LKDVGVDALADVIRRAARGEAVLHPQVTARVIREVQGARSLVADLSERELEVLKLVLSEKTVKGHISNILGKLQLADRTQAAVFAWREGMMRDES